MRRSVGRLKQLKVKISLPGLSDRENFSWVLGRRNLSAVLGLEDTKPSKKSKREADSDERPFDRTRRRETS